MKKEKKELARKLFNPYAEELNFDEKDWQVFENRLQEVIDTNLRAFIEAEIARENREKKEIFNEAEVGKVRTHAIASNQNFGYNQAKEETITHLKELDK